MDFPEPEPSNLTRAAVPFALDILLAVVLVGSVVVNEAFHRGISLDGLILWMTGSWIVRFLAAYFAVRRTPNFRSYVSAAWPLAAVEILAAIWLSRPVPSGIGWNWSQCVAGASLTAGFSLCLYGLWLIVGRTRDSASKPQRLTGVALVAAGLAPGAFVMLFAIGMARR